ncbi:ubiquitin carboxyl-terminal hydrolase calypso-like [Watersipora subatra]|uniref:ubiquitin carboxyl-terminal hydrolase calypso-like n=1 Tax=Watersipora subatra TaxID=2589382 RepID=UPI00355BFCC7
MAEPWYELESDPGLFTLLVEDFGIEGVQVEEIYDIDTVTEMCSEALGFIFLFRWIEDRRRRRKLMDEHSLSVKDSKILRDIFFAHQVIPNSCATHALLSILLNSDGETVKLTDELLELKTSTRGMIPEQKGDAIGRIPRVANAHNSHASPHLRHQQEKKSSAPTASQAGEAYHYVSYLPVNGRLYEMDGLKPWPLDHGEVEKGDWTQKFSDVIAERLGGGDIMFNLMAVVPDKRLGWRRKLQKLQENCDAVTKDITEVMMYWRDNTPDPLQTIIPTNEALTIKVWIELIKEEHRYCLVPARADSPTKASKVVMPVVEKGMIPQLNALLTALTETDEDSTSEVVVYQTSEKSDERRELLELSEFDPFELTCIEAQRSNTVSTNSFSVQELIEMLTDLKSYITDTEQQLKEQEDLRDKYKIDVCRRTHNYYPFVTTFLRMLAEQGLLNDMVNQLTQSKKKLIQSTVTSNHSSRAKKRSHSDRKRSSSGYSRSKRRR